MALFPKEATKPHQTASLIFRDYLRQGIHFSHAKQNIAPSTTFPPGLCLFLLAKKALKPSGERTFLPPMAVSGTWDWGGRWMMAPAESRCSPHPLLVPARWPTPSAIRLLRAASCMPAPRACLEEGDESADLPDFEAGLVPARCPARIQLSHSSNNWQDGVRARLSGSRNELISFGCPGETDAQGRGAKGSWSGGRAASSLAPQGEERD